ncbi:MAG: hypothetical protein AAB215_07910 [Planctomycetota bacterium]
MRNLALAAVLLPSIVGYMPAVFDKYEHLAKDKFVILGRVSGLVERFELPDKDAPDKKERLLAYSYKITPLQILRGDLKKSDEFLLPAGSYLVPGDKIGVLQKDGYRYSGGVAGVELAPGATVLVCFNKIEKGEMLPDFTPFCIWVAVGGAKGGLEFEEYTDRFKEPRDRRPSTKKSLEEIGKFKIDA